MRTEVPRGLSPRQGCCNSHVVANVFAGFMYCWRPDNGSGMCNVHQAATERGQRMREASTQRLRANGWRRSA